MSLSKEERDRILYLLEAGQVSAAEASHLLDALDVTIDKPAEPVRERTLRIRATNINPRQPRSNVIASMPVHLLKLSVRLGGYLLPQLNTSTIQDVLRTIDEGGTGRLLDIQDMEQGERLEVFVE
jgi:hypothetical protein